MIHSLIVTYTLKLALKNNKINKKYAISMIKEIYSIVAHLKSSLVINFNYSALSTMPHKENL